MSSERAYLSSADYRLLPAPPPEQVPGLDAEAGDDRFGAHDSDRRPQHRARCEMHLSPRLQTEVVPLVRLLTALSAPARLGVAVCLNAATVVHGDPARAKRVLVSLNDKAGTGGVFRRCRTAYRTRTQASSGGDGPDGA